MLVCLAAQGEVVHLFVVPRSELPDAPTTSTPAFARVQGWATANWTQGDTSYLVLTRGNTAFLKNLLSGSRRS